MPSAQTARAAHRERTGSAKATRLRTSSFESKSFGAAGNFKIDEQHAFRRKDKGGAASFAHSSHPWYTADPKEGGQ